MSRMESLVSVVRQGKDVWNRYLKTNPGVKDFSGAQLSGLDLSGMNFQGANLQGADLSEAVLDGTNFEGANLKGANFMRATFTQTTKILPGQLAKTAFWGAKGLSIETVRVALGSILESCTRPARPTRPAPSTRDPDRTVE